MADLKFQPVRHDHKAFLEKTSRHEMLAARTRSGLIQKAAATLNDCTR